MAFAEIMTDDVLYTEDGEEYGQFLRGEQYSVVESRIRHLYLEAEDGSILRVPQSKARVI